MKVMRHFSAVSSVTKRINAEIKKKTIEFDPILSTIPVLSQLIDKSAFNNYDATKPATTTKRRTLPDYADKTKLPGKVTDIKGIDPEAYFVLNSYKASHHTPQLVDNPYFTLKFFPKEHFVSDYRKSNIAYTFPNHGGYKLNDPVLEKSINQYKGRYRSNTFFQEKLTPFSTAFGRTRYRKLLKRLLFNAVKEVENKEPDSLELAGIYKFTFKKVPNTVQDITQCQKDISSGVNTILHHNSYRAKLLHSCTQAKIKKGDVNKLKMNATLYNTVRPQRVAGFVPKYPFQSPRLIRKR